MRRLVASAFALASAAVAAQARGGDPLVVHRTEDTRDCPDAATLARAVEAQARHPGPELWAHRAVDVQISRSDEGYTAIVHVGDASRTIADRGRTCAALAEALAVTIAIALEEGAIDAPPPPPTTPSQPASAQPPREIELHEPPRSAAPPPPAPTIGVGFGVVSGLVHDVEPALNADVEVVVGPLLVAAGALGLPEQTTQLGPGTVTVRFLGGYARAAWPVVGRAQVAWLGPTLGPVVGDLHATGQGYTTNGAADRAWGGMAATVRGGGRLFGPMHWAADAGAAVAFGRQHFTIDGLGPSFSTAPASFLARVELRVPIW